MKSLKPATTSAVSKPRRIPLRRILVPLDFSEISRQALPYAVEHAEHFGAELILVHVLETFPVDYLVGLHDVKKMHASAEDEAKARLAKVARDLPTGNGIRVKTYVAWGKPFEAVCKAAQRFSADQIILTTHGYTGLKHAYLGSTAERIVRSSPCPVLVVPAQQR